MLVLLAQLIEPALQPGPVRLPAPSVLEQPSTQEQPPKVELNPDFQITPLAGDETVSEILSRCQGDSSGNQSQQQLERCAIALTAELTEKGFVNSRVVVDRASQPPRLEYIEGRLVELQITTSEAHLRHKAKELIEPLQQQAFNLPKLERALQQLRRLPGVAGLKANLNRLGSDRSKATLQLTITAATYPWQGQLSLRNDGNAGSGEGRALLALQKRNLAQNQDQMLFVGELDSDKDPEMGYLLGSLSYTMPIAKNLDFTGAFGISRRNLIEHPQPLHDLSFRQLQGFGQFKWMIKSSESNQSYAFAGLSVNRSNSYLSNKPVPLVAGGGSYGWLRSGFLRAGLGHTGVQNKLRWAGQIYGLQGIAGLSTEHQLKSLGKLGVHPGEAQAIGASAVAHWLATPRLNFTARAAGQAALNSLPNDMGFSLGSDSGLKGLPGQLVSGDSGYLGSLEAAYTLWKGRQNKLQIVPFLGAGEIRSVRRSLEFEDTAGAGGVVARWLQGQAWNLELGWVSPFETGDRGVWGDWLLSQGIYTKLELRF